MGESALPALKVAAAGKDPEASRRSRDLLRKIQLGIMPDSSPKIAELVLRYDRGSTHDRLLVIQELRKQKAWRQILKLYELEESEESLAILEDATRGVAIEAARSCLASDTPDVAGAFAYLAMGRPASTERMATASLHRALGSLDEELRKPVEGDKKEQALRRYPLLAVAGRTLEAARAAEQAGLPVHAARLHLLAGNPLPWLMVEPGPQRSSPSPALGLYREFVIRRWGQGASEAHPPRELRRLALAEDDEDGRLQQLRLLFLAGDAQEAEKRLRAIDPRAAFHYLESAERVDEALRVLGMDPAKPDFAAWAMKRFRVLIDDPDSEEGELLELSLLGYFLEKRGLLDELREAFVAPLGELAQADPEGFTRVAASLLSGPFDALELPVVEPVLEAADRFAGDDEGRWLELVGTLFEEREGTDRLWSWLGRIDPAARPSDRLRKLSRILGLLADPTDERAVFFEKSWKEVSRMDLAGRGEMIACLVDLADQSGDSENFLRGMDLLERDGPEDAGRRFKGEHLAATGRWKEAAEEWMKLARLQPSDAAYRAYAAACYRRSGDEPAAAKQERHAELLALGVTVAQFQCAEAFGAAGDFRRAALWWRRAGTECTLASGAFDAVVIRLGEQAQAEGDWRLAAAISEAQAFKHAQALGEGFPQALAFSVAASLRLRIEADLARAFSCLERDRGNAVREMERVAAMPYADIALADHFFAPMRAAGLVDLHDRSFERIWHHLVGGIEAYPENDNARNSAAWLAARANRRLDEAEKHLSKALEIHPRQAAYLDTMAELRFVRSDRKGAVAFSARALREDSGDIQLLRQHQRFRNAPFPPR